MKKSPITLKEIVIALFIVLALVVIAIPNYITSRDRAKIAEVKSNMHTIQLAAEDFSTMAEGCYPGGIKTTIHQVWPPLLLDYCIAGAERPPFPSNALISKLEFQNPFCYYFPAIKNGRIASREKGCVYYCAYDQNGNVVGEGEAAVIYEIRGVGRGIPLTFMLSNREE
ncbi:MAG: hypothetical protein E3J87_00430 [Candidatus Cloacimonadota bacterium]|nr:MAG: hypothetical protein E3J87_00430 [Candidatus Cloacimonadota bacterium]